MLPSREHSLCQQLSRAEIVALCAGQPHKNGGVQSVTCICAADQGTKREFWDIFAIQIDSVGLDSRIYNRPSWWKKKQRRQLYHLKYLFLLRQLKSRLCCLNCQPRKLLPSPCWSNFSCDISPGWVVTGRIADSKLLMQTLPQPCQRLVARSHAPGRPDCRWMRRWSVCSAGSRPRSQFQPRWKSGTGRLTRSRVGGGAKRGRTFGHPPLKPQT